jgi:hypothetical protein
MQVILLLAFVLPSFVVQEPPAGKALQSATDTAAFTRIAAERNSEAKKKLALNFEKNFPKSKHLPEVYIQLSRVLVSQSDFTTAKQYADKAVSAVHMLEGAPPENADRAWYEWLNTLGSSARSNLAWVNQMVTWQQQQVRSAVLDRRN